jgi:23S rRNA pseudouridine1911/1915/1917 synthase
MQALASPDDRLERTDIFVSSRFGITRSRAGRLIREGLVRVNGETVKPGHTLRRGDEVEVSMPPPDSGELIPEDIPLDVLFSDDHLVVVNKQAGLVVYPAAGHPGGTMMNALKARFGELARVGGPLRPGVVHRLDKDTSGVMVVALSDDAYYSLVEQFKSRSTSRAYHALVAGVPGKGEGVVESPIGRSAHDRKKMSTRTRRGKEARTSWKVIRGFSCASLIEARLDTGRTHQIRVHMASLGHPVLGDRIYGRRTSMEQKGQKVRFPRQMLHAATLGFDHPATGERMEFSVALPEDMVDAIAALEALG